MGCFYHMNRDVIEVLEALKAGEIADCEHVYAPITDRGERSLWPWGVVYRKGTPQEAYAWFEEPGIIHFWGASPHAPDLMRALQRAGIRLSFGG